MQMTRPGPLAILAVPLVAMAAALAAAWAVPASAQVTPPPPLTGTFLRAVEGAGGEVDGSIEITGACDAQPPQISWTASGNATGPYPGPYTETGTATEADPGARTFTFTAEFTIDSQFGLVSGTKGVSVPGGTFDCTEFVGSVRTFLAGHENAPYTATITTATGTCTTEGTSSIIVGEQFIPSIRDREGFSESFNTGTVPVCTPTCPPGDDEDGDGLTDSRESILSTLVGVADSDGDGVVDGNDDANGNGDDDEDEDDDDDCPDEDSDGDGEDDEDEDDDDEGDDD